MSTHPDWQPTIVSAIQRAMDNLKVPDSLSESKAEYWKAGARACIEAVNAALSDQPTRQEDAR